MNPRTPKAPLAAICALFIPALIGMRFPIRVTQDPKQDQEAPPIKLKTDLVSVTAAVNDREGRAIKSLGIDDFVVYENGIRQKIALFNTSEEAFSLMLLLDISGSTSDEIELMKSAARSFLAELRKEDRAGVIVFSREVELIADFSDSRSKAESAIAGVATAEATNGHRFNPNTGTSFYDGVYLAVAESPLKQAHGRKAIVCMTDGVDSTSKLGYAEVAKLAEQSDASVYFLQLDTEAATLEALLKPKTDPSYVNLSQSQIKRYYDEYDPDSIDSHRPASTFSPSALRKINGGLYTMARREMRELAERTGGRVYPVATLGDLEGVYKQLAAELRSQYSIGYYSSNTASDGRWRTIRVEVHRAGAVVRARSGYWAPGR